MNATLIALYLTPDATTKRSMMAARIAGWSFKRPTTWRTRVRETPNRTPSDLRRGNARAGRFVWSA